MFPEPLVAHDLVRHIEGTGEQVWGHGVAWHDGQLFLLRIWGEGSLLASCARATRGLGRPSLDARSGRSSRPPSYEVRGSLELGGGQLDRFFAPRKWE